LSSQVWIAATLLSAMALAASLRLSTPVAAQSRLGRALDIAAHPTWLLPLILAMGVAVGLMIRGDLSPWPPEAAEQLARRGGPWAGATGFIVVVIVDLWLLWTPSMVTRRFAAEDAREAMRWLPALNLALGAVLLGAFYLAAH